MHAIGTCQRAPVFIIRRSFVPAIRVIRLIPIATQAEHGQFVAHSPPRPTSRKTRSMPGEFRMKYLLLLMTRGPLLAEVIRGAAQDPRRRSLCACCGAKMLINPGRAEQTVRCPGCSRMQRVTAQEEVPWRLT